MHDILFNSDHEANTLPTLYDVEKARSEQDRLVRKFRGLVTTTQECVKEANVNIPEFINYLTILPPELEEEHEQFLEEKAPQFCDTTLGVIFCRLNRYWNYLNYSLLEHVVKEYGGEGLKQEMQGYVTDVQLFQKMTTLHVFKQIYKKHLRDEIPKDFRKIISEHHENWSNLTLDKVEEFRQKLVSNYKLPEFALVCLKVASGSVVIVWLIPSSFVATLKDDVRKSKKEILEEADVLKLMRDGDLVYEAPEKMEGELATVCLISCWDTCFVCSGESTLCCKFKLLSSCLLSQPQ